MVGVEVQNDRLFEARIRDVVEVKDRPLVGILGIQGTRAGPLVLQRLAGGTAQRVEVPTFARPRVHRTATDLDRAGERGAERRLIRNGARGGRRLRKQQQHGRNEHLFPY